MRVVKQWIFSRWACSSIVVCVMTSVGAWWPWAAHGAYAMKVTITAPKGSTGEKPAAKYPVATKTIPCDGPGFDAITMTATYDATNASKVVDRDVYLMLYSPEGIGGDSAKYLVMSKQNIGSSFLLLKRPGLADLSSSEVFIPRSENLSTAGAFTETLLGSAISVQGAEAGVWQLVGIVADKARISFDNPATWDAWDVATVILRKPWKGSGATQLCD